jgi:hypothetical protein
MHPYRRLVVVLAVALLLGSLLNLSGLAGMATAVGAWSAHGPSGGTVTALKVSPSGDGTIYAGTGGAGVFVSSDRGATWQRRSAGLPTDAFVTDIDVAAADPSVVYLTTLANGAWRSSDAGATWRLVYRAGTVDSVAVDPTNPDTVYLGGVGAATFKSVDGGATWIELIGLYGRSFGGDEIAIAPSDPAVVYATDPPALLRSDDAGATWQSTDAAARSVEDIAVHPTDPLVVYLATWFDGVMKSIDGGRSWSPAGTGLPALAALSVAIDPAQPSTVYAGMVQGGVIYRSVDAGATWQLFRVSGATGQVGQLEVEPSTGYVYAGPAAQGVFRSTDRGMTWARRSAGLIGSHVRSLVVVPAAPATIYAGTYGDGVHRSTNAGASWSRRGLTGRVVNGLAVHRSAPGTIYAATDRGVYKSTDEGGTWRLLPSGFTGISGIAVAPSNRAVLYATYFSGVIKSTDGGGTWRRLALPDWDVYLGGVAVHPTRPERAWVGTRFSGVLRTTDGGTTWRSGPGCPSGSDARAVTVDPVQPSILYAGCDTGGVSRSSDGGATWAHVTPLDIYAVRAIVVDPSDTRRLYIGEYDAYGPSGVHGSADRGQTWTQLSGTGLTTTWVESLAITPDGAVLHAGTTQYGMDGSGGGAFTYHLR